MRPPPATRRHPILSQAANRPEKPSPRKPPNPLPFRGSVRVGASPIPLMTPSLLMTPTPCQPRLRIPNIIPDTCQLPASPNPPILPPSQSGRKWGKMGEKSKNPAQPSHQVKMAGNGRKWQGNQKILLNPPNPDVRKCPKMSGKSKNSAPGCEPLTPQAAPRQTPPNRRKV